MNMKADNVAEYLQNNPDFFNQHAELLTELVIPHPYGGRTVSLSERQMLMLRERVKELEKKLNDWMEIAKDNEALQSKVHQYTLEIVGAKSSELLLEIATRKLCEIFSIPHAVIHLWQVQPPSAEVIAFADEHKLPVCAHQAVHDTQSWFGESAGHLRSFAYIPLRNENQSIGMLILASEDAQRFYPEMGTVFLQRIADIISRAVKPV